MATCSLLYKFLPATIESRVITMWWVPVNVGSQISTINPPTSYFWPGRSQFHPSNIYNNTNNDSWCLVVAIVYLTIDLIDSMRSGLRSDSTAERTGNIMLTNPSNNPMAKWSPQMTWPVVEASRRPRAFDSPRQLPDCGRSRLKTLTERAMMRAYLPTGYSLDTLDVASQREG